MGDTESKAVGFEAVGQSLRLWTPLHHLKIYRWNYFAFNSLNSPHSLPLQGLPIISMCHLTRVVECKNQEVSEQEFKQAIEQAFNYAHGLAGIVKYVWVTKGNKEEFYHFDKEKNIRIIVPDIPYFGENTSNKYKYAKGGVYRDRVQM